MAAQHGKDFLLKIEDAGTPGTYLDVGGFRSNSFRMNNETIDITSKSSNSMRELLNGGGIQSFTASGSGVFIDDTAFSDVEGLARSKALHKWQIIVPDFGTYEAEFQITDLEFSGEHNGELTYSLTLESSGAVTFAAI